MKKQIKNKENNIFCLDDIDCKNKRCYKLHNERRRLNICKFDIFFVPYKDDGCHFEDCNFNHPKRNSFYIEKEKDFDNLIISVVNHLELDDDKSITNDWKRLMLNINQDDFNKVYQELYSYYVIVNKLSYKLESLQFNDPQSYIYFLQNILSNIYINHTNFNRLLKNAIMLYNNHMKDFVFLCNKLQEDIQYVSMFKYNTKNMLYQNYGININF